MTGRKLKDNEELEIDMPFRVLNEDEEDMVNHPPHYKLFPDLKVIEAIQKMLTPKEYRGYLKGNVLKYRLRAGKKGAPEITLEDIQKSIKYEEFLQAAEIKRGEQTDD